MQYEVGEKVVLWVNKVGPCTCDEGCVGMLLGWRLIGVPVSCR